MKNTFDECLDDMRAGAAWSSVEMLVLRDLWDLCTSTYAARVRSASRGSLPVPEVRPVPSAPYSLSVQTVTKRPRETAAPPRKLRMRGVPSANPLD
eukprot:2799130-Heterocapsa_arctica.AAC.1